MTFRKPTKEEANKSIVWCRKMAKFSRVCKVTVVVRGCYAGKKVVIVKPHDEGSKEPQLLTCLGCRYREIPTEDYWRARSEEDCHEDLN